MGFTHNDTSKKTAFEEMEKGAFPLYTQKALTERWGVSRGVIYQWSKRFNNFPKAVEGLVLGAGPYYPAYEVERFEKSPNFKPDRKPGNPNWI